MQNEILQLLTTVDRLKLVQRQSYVSVSERIENSAEHSWHVAFAAWVLARTGGASIDVEKMLRIALVHDLGEIGPGDTFAYGSKDGESTARERESLKAILASIPDNLRSEVLEAWDEYANQLCEEAKWVKVADMLLPFLLNLATQGRTWREKGVSIEMVLKRNAPVADMSPGLYDWMEKRAKDALAEGWLFSDTDR